MKANQILQPDPIKISWCVCVGGYVCVFAHSEFSLV